MLRVGTRRSPLAQAQADRVLALLAAQGLAAGKVLVEGAGDQDGITPMHSMESPGAFTKTLTQAVLDGRIDAAVHSLKDLPLEAPPGAPVVAILARDDPADVLLAAKDALDANAPLGLRAGARVGTTAPRRQAQLRHIDPSLVPVDVRGNVGTRLSLLEAGVVDALLMAAAVFGRIDLPLPAGVAPRRLAPEAWPGGPGQGAVAVQARAGLPGLEALRALDDAATRRAVEAERRLLGLLGGGCGLPLGAHVRQEGAWRLHAVMDHGTGPARAELEGDDPERLAAEAADLLRRAPPPPAEARPVPGAPVVLITLADVAGHRRVLAPELDARAWPLVRTEPTGEPMPGGEWGWIAVTSRRGAPFARQAAKAMGRLPRVAAVGPATAAALRGEGLPVHLVAAHGDGRSLGEGIAAFPRAAGAVLWPCASKPAGGLADVLAAKGVRLVPWRVYRSLPAATPAPVGEADALVLTSPSAVAAWRAHPAPPRVGRVVALGPTTGAALDEAGVPHAVCAGRLPEDLRPILETTACRS